MNIDSIDELKKLAGLLNPNTPVVDDTISLQPEQDCGCNSPESDTDTMRKYMDLSTFEEDEDELEEGEWANSTDHFDGDHRGIEPPKGAVVDTSLRRNLKAKGNHVTVDESTLDEGFKDKLKVLALLGLTGFGLNYALDATSAKNSPLGKALYAASQQGDTEAGNYLKNIDAIIDGRDTGTLQMLNDKYLHDENRGTLTTESMMESYKMYKDRTKERQKQRVKNSNKDNVRATQGGGGLKGMESIEEDTDEIERYNVVNKKTKAVVGSAKSRTRARNILDKKDNEYGSYAHYIVPVYKKAVEEAYVHKDFSDNPTPLPNKKAYDIEKASETKKKVSLAPEPWKNEKEPIKESIDLTQLKKNAGLL